MIAIRTLACTLLASVQLAAGQTPDQAPAKAVDPATWSDAYARRTFKLGMSMKEFRATPHPDSDKHPRAFPVCSNEPRADVPFVEARISPDWLAAGAVKCVFYVSTTDPPSQRLVGMDMGGIDSRTEFYFVRSAPGMKLRLFLILSDGPTDQYGELVLTLVAALGKPKDLRVEKVTSKAGGEFENSIAIWSNSSSMLVAERYGRDLNTLIVKHMLNDLWDIFQTNLEQVRAEKAKAI